MFDVSDADTFRRKGYLIARGLFSETEAQELSDHFHRLRDEDSRTYGSELPDLNVVDPLKHYPRIMQPHRWDETSLFWLIDPRLADCLRTVLGKDPYAVQTMFYFKPPGSRGQALHQDQYYLRVQPGTCIAAWLAIDHCDEENGCLQLVPGSQDLPVLCPQLADPKKSFTDVTVPIPEAMEKIPLVMEPGDVLFFNGSLIHGSYPNSSGDRFRRALIGHYIVGEAEKVAKFFHPVLAMDGSEVKLGISEGGGPCGVWVERDEEQVVETTAWTFPYSKV